MAESFLPIGVAIMTDEKSEPLCGWPKNLEIIPPGSSEPYIAATNLRPIGTTTWPADWRDHASYGPMPQDETASRP